MIEEYRVRWTFRGDPKPKFKTFGQRGLPTARELVVSLGDVPYVTDVRLQHRRVTPWEDVPGSEPIRDDEHQHDDGEDD